MAATSILINVGAKTDQAVRGLTDVEKSLKRQDDAIKKSSGGWKKAAGVLAGLAAGAAVGDYLMDAAKAAAADAAETSKLNKILDNNTKATDAQIDAASAWIDQMEIATTVSDSDLRASLGKLTAQTGDLSKAQEATALAVDVAAGKNISLSASTKIVEKALAGQTKTLQKQHPEWDTNHDKILDSEEAMKGLGDSYGGAAEAAVDPWTQIQTIFGQLKEQIGGFVLPLLDKVKDWLNSPGNVAQLQETLGQIGETARDMGEKIAAAIGWLIDNQGTVKTIAAVLATIGAAMVVVNGAIAVWNVLVAIWSAVTAVASAVGAVFGAVMAVITSPITLIILAIVALIAIVVLLWKNWDTVTKALGAAWQWLKRTAIAVFNAVKDFLAAVWQGIKDKVTAVWGGIKSWLAGVWASIKSTAVNAFNALKSKLSEIWTGIKDGAKDKMNALLDFVKDLPARILRGFSNIGSLLFNVGKDLIQGLINGIKSAAGSVSNAIKGVIPDWVPGPWSVAPAAAGVSAQSLGRTTPTTHTSMDRLNITVQVDQWGSARVTKRAIEANDRRQGRPVGRALAVAW